MRGRLKVAVIDDDRESLDLVCHALAWLDARTACLAFFDAAVALEYLRREPVDLIITDLRMPGMDGFAFIREFRKADVTTPIVLVSSDPMPPADARAAGANAFVGKSSLKGQLASIVADVMPVHHGST